MEVKVLRLFSMSKMFQRNLAQKEFKGLKYEMTNERMNAGKKVTVGNERE